MYPTIDRCPKKAKTRQCVLQDGQGVREQQGQCNYDYLFI